jgi:galactose mutarotase-like enzyme
MSQQHPAWIRLDSGSLAAEIDPLGAQLSLLREAAGHDLLWNGDPAFWSGRAPLLFPIVGALAGGAYRLGSNSYPLSRHGFARGKLFTLREATSSTAAFRLGADAATLQIYPFRFELDVSYELKSSTLSVTTSVRNAGDTDMPASFGYHPGFRWPLPFGKARSSHFIQFDAAEPAPFRRLDAAGLVAPEQHPTPITNRRWILTDDIFKDDVVFFDRIRSRSVSYGAEDGPRIQVSFPDTPYFGVWTKPGAPFICIEPWHGYADPRGFTGDFKDKPGVFSVPPGADKTMKMEIALLGA